MVFVVFIFFFKQKTAYEMRISDWSSDVCSSDLDGTGSFACFSPAILSLSDCAQERASAELKSHKRTQALPSFAHRRPRGLTLLTENVPSPAPQIARVYLRVSTAAQALRRQNATVGAAQAEGQYVAEATRAKEQRA